MSKRRPEIAKVEQETFQVHDASDKEPVEVLYWTVTDSLGRKHSAQDKERAEQMFRDYYRNWRSK